MSVTRQASWAIAMLAVGLFAGSAMAQFGGGGAGNVGVAANPPATQPGQADAAKNVGAFVTQLTGVAATQPGQVNFPGGGGGQVQVRIQAGGQAGGQQVMIGGANVAVMGGGGGMQSSSMQTAGVGKIDYASNNGAQTLTVADANGKQLFSGPVDTPEQKKKVPAEAIAIMRQMVGQNQAMQVRRLNMMQRVGRRAARR